MSKQKKEKKEKAITLETILMNCRNALRGYGSFEKNRDAIISLTFLKFASDKFEKRKQEIISEHGNNEVFINKVSFYNSKNVYFLDEHCTWSYLVRKASEKDISLKIDTALKDIEDKNPPLKGALPQNAFISLGAPKEKVKTLIDEINHLNYERFQDEDLIGRVYEYFLTNFAASASKEDGEFYTPSCVVKLIAELIEPYKGTVYDPCCGSGGMFIQSVKFVEAHKGNKTEVSVVGQESTPETWRLAKMNLSIRGISCDLGLKNASTFTDDQHKGRIVDYIMANPPFNLKGWREEGTLEDDPRFKPYKPGMPPVSNANYAWILHMLSKLDVQNGIAGFLLANGALNAGAGGEEDDEEGGQAQYLIRKRILEDDKVEAIIVLPRNMFYTTDISVTLWILNNNKKKRTLNGRKIRDRKNEVLFIDLRTWNQNITTYKIDKKTKKKKVVLTDEQIEDIKHMYFNWQDADTTKYEDIPELCKSVTLDEIRRQNYSLIPSKYIKFIDHDKNIKFNNEIKKVNINLQTIIDEENKADKMLKDLKKFTENVQDIIKIGKIEYKRLGEFIEEQNNRNSDLSCKNVRGVDSSSHFCQTKAKLDGVELNNYKIVEQGDFAYNPSRINIGSIALNNGEKCIISPMYIVFRINSDKLLPEYLMTYFSRKEFFRSTFFFASGSVRDTFSIEAMKSTIIPIPTDIEIQKTIANIYKVNLMKYYINEQIKESFKNLPSIILSKYIK